MTTNGKKIPWPRILVEGVVIIGSILMAFGIDAWWEGLQQREQEQQALVGLESDFVVNVERLRTVLRVHESAEALVTELQRMSASQLAAIPPDSVGRYVTALAVPFDFDSQDGTLDALVASGRLGVITDPRLSELLAGWKSIVADADEEVAVMRSRSAEIQLLEARLGGPWRRAAPGGGSSGLTGITSHYPGADLAVIASDADLMALARAKVFSSVLYLSEVREILSHAESILEHIRANDR